LTTTERANDLLRNVGAERKKSAITDEQAARILQDVCGMPGKPANEQDMQQALRSLGKVLKRHAQTLYHARAIVQHVVETRQFFPAPACIVEAAQNQDIPAEEPPKLRAADPGCQVCFGTGFITVERNGYSGAGVCQCRKL
jgi:site-specific recombinase XerC